MVITAEIIVAMGTAFAAVIASTATCIISVRNGRKVEQVHTLVNSKMTEAKNEIARLSQRLATLTGDTGDVERAKTASSEASHHGTPKQ